MILTKLSFVVFILFAFASCTNHDKTPIKRDCKCPLDDIVNEQIDSTTNKSESQLSGDIQGKVEIAQIKKFVENELKGGLKYTTSESYTTTMIKKYENQFPEFSGKILNFRIGRLFYCALDNSECQDTSISNEDLRKIRELEIPKVKKEFLEKEILKTKPIEKLSNISKSNSIKKQDKMIFIRLNTSTKGINKITVNGKGANIVNSTAYEAQILIRIDEDNSQEIIVYSKSGDSCKFNKIIKFEDSNIDNTLICKN
jgi:hypothetical protein